MAATAVEGRLNWRAASRMQAKLSFNPPADLALRGHPAGNINARPSISRDRGLGAPSWQLARAHQPHSACAAKGINKRKSE